MACELADDSRRCKVEQIGVRNRSQAQGRRTTFKSDAWRWQPRIAKDFAQFLLRSQARFRPGPALSDKIAQFDLLSLRQAMIRGGADNIVIIVKVLAKNAICLDGHVVIDDKIE